MNQRLGRWVCSFILSIAGVCHAATPEEMAFQAAMKRYSANDFAACSQGFLRLVRAYPTKSLYWFNLGNCLYMNKDYARAHTAYSKVVALHGPLLPAGMLYQAKALKMLGRVDEAQKILENLLQKKIPRGLQAEARLDLESLGALRLYQQGSYAEAEAELRREQNLSGSGQLLLGLSLVRQGKNSEAEFVLEKTMRAPDLSVEDRAIAQGLLRQIKLEPTKSKDLWFFADIAYGQTSNAYLEGRSYEPVPSPLLRASAGGGYKRFAYLFDYEEFAKVPELKTQTHSLQWPLSYRHRSYEFSFMPYLQGQIWGSTPVLFKTGGLFRNAILLTSSSSLGGDLEAISQNSLSEGSSYLSGSSYSARLFYGFTKRTWSSQLFWLLGIDGTQDIDYADGSRLPMQHTYQGPGARVTWSMNKATTLFFQLAYLERRYKNNSLPADKPRNDQELNSLLKISYAFSKGWAVYVLAEYNPNKSTLAETDVRDKNYENLNMLAGLGGELF